MNVSGASSFEPTLNKCIAHIFIIQCGFNTIHSVFEKCNDPIDLFKYLQFTILDVLTNTESLSIDDIEDFLLEKEIFSYGTL